MKDNYIMILTDIEPVEFRRLIQNKEQPDELQIIKFDKKPNPLDAMEIDINQLTDKEWKHVYKVEYSKGDLLSIKDYVTSYMKARGNIFGFQEL